MKLQPVKNIFLFLIAIFITFTPLKTINALTPDWVDVPESPYGKQFWDMNNVQKNQDGSIRVLSKFVPKSTTKITDDILYTMDIKCPEKLFKDIAVGTKDFNDFKNTNSEWKDPNGDVLILGVIDQVCTFEK